jgi:hypothetical protein
MIRIYLWVRFRRKPVFGDRGSGKQDPRFPAITSRRYLFEAAHVAVQDLSSAA